MSAVDPANPPPYQEISEDQDPQRRLYRGIVAILVLIGVAIALGVGFLLLEGQVPNWSAALAAWSWVVTVVLVILAVAIAISIVRVVVLGVGGGSRFRQYERRRYRRMRSGATDQGPSAVEIARQRFARGEISEDQLDQILKGLARGP